MMSAKALSTGTLSLRFMQNAHRAKQMAAVEADQAQVKDEAEWEVGKEVRDAWGISGGADDRDMHSVSYESSYMPFLFDREAFAETSKPKGRRTFGKSGQEIIEEEKSEAAPAPVHDPSTTSLSGSTKRLTSISGSGSGSSTKLHSKDTKMVLTAAKASSSSASQAKSAKQLIRDSSGVGTDMQSMSRPATLPSSLGNTFLKPSGVDDPTNHIQYHVPADVNHRSDSDVAVGARAKAKVKKIKREREIDADGEDGGKDGEIKEKKRKKKKKTVALEE